MVVPFVSWHDGSVPAEIVIAVGVPTVGVTGTFLEIIAEGPLQPKAWTLIVNNPQTLLFQCMIPVVGSIYPSAGSLTHQ